MSSLTVLHNTREQAPTHTHALKLILSHFVANNNNNDNDTTNHNNNNNNTNNTNNSNNNNNNNNKNKIREVLTRVREKRIAPRRGEPRSGFTMSSTAMLLYENLLK